MSKWPDGTRKSTGNAFDWRNRGPSIFAKPTQGEKVSQGMAQAVSQGKTVGKPITIKKTRK